ncbi:MAG: hypothetical protein ACYDHY_10700 [Acidiferrobacterales bacterium]
MKDRGPGAAHRIQASSGRVWNGYAPYNPAMVQKLLDIFRVVHILAGGQRLQGGSTMTGEEKDL